MLAELEAFRVREDILLTGPVPAEDLPGLHSGAEIFVFPSLYEGFGLPLLEAMSCGTAVVVSNGGALPELASDAGRLVDPEDALAFAGAMCRLGADPALRARFAQAGLAQAVSSRWMQSAMDLLSVVAEAGSRRGTRG